MVSKLTGAAGAFVVMMGLSYVWHEVAMAGFYADFFASIARTEPNMVFVAGGYVVAAAIMAYMYPFGAQGGSPIGEGLRFGALMGMFWWLPASLVQVGIFTEVTAVQAIVDGVWHGVEGAGGGVVIALMHARGAGVPDQAA